MKALLSSIKLLVPLLLMYSTLKAQSFYTIPTDYSFHNFQIQDNDLYRNFVYDIYQDKKGFIWICTLYGLYRYDGYHFKEYLSDPNDSHSISGNSPIKILSSKKDGFWIGVRSTGITLSGEGLDYFDSESERFTNYLLDTKQANNPQNIVNDMLWDLNGTSIWVGTNGGLMQFDPTTKEAKVLPSTINLKVYSLKQRNQALWIGTNKGVYVYENNSLVKQAHLLDQTKISDIFFYADDEVLLGSSKGLFRYNRKSDELAIIPFVEKLLTIERTAISERYINNIKKIFRDQEGTIWIGTQAGLFVFDEGAKKLKSYCDPIRQNNSYLINRVNTIFQDRMGALWLGKSNGLSRIRSLKGKVQKYKLVNPSLMAFAQKNNPRVFDINGTKRSTSSSVKVIHPSSTDFDWVGTSLGLYQFDLESGTFYQNHPIFQKIPALKERNITSILVKSPDQIWIGANNNTTHPREAQEQVLYYYDTNLPTPKKISSKSKPNKIPAGAIKAIVEDSLGNIWIASPKGLIKYLVKEDRIITYDHDPKDITTVSSNHIRIVYKDKYQQIWVGTNDTGLNLYKYDSDSFLRFKNELDKRSLTNNRINTLYHGTDDWIWVGTELGLNKIHPIDLQIERIAFNHKHSSIKGIIERDSGTLWISTAKKLYTYNFKNKVVSNCTEEDGVGKEFFINAACHKSSSEDIFFGSTTGLYRIPKDIDLSNSLSPSLEYTSILINQKEVKDSAFVQEFRNNNHLSLQSDQNHLSVQFAVLDYSAVNDKQYRYKLEGLDDAWQFIGERNEIHFDNLSPGNYILHLEGGKSDGIFKAKAQPLSITIIPPWYWNTFSKLLYSLLLMGLIYWIYSFQLNQAIKTAETKRLQELNLFKSKMYANFTHEIKAPISVIQGLTQEIKGEQYKKEIDLINRSSENLTKLVDGILNLNRIETAMFPVNMIYDNIISYLHYLLESYRTRAEESQIEMTFMPAQSNLKMDYDPEIINHIVNNLLSNAIKFTPKGGQINITANHIHMIKGEALELKFIDSGVGLDRKDLSRIFDEFYQASTITEEQKQIGTGIGLSFTKELVELLKGKIRVTSTLGIGSTFSVQLPISSNASLPAIMTKEQSDKSMESSIKENLLILVVEDNVEVREYLQMTLDHKFKVLVAENGHQGLQMAIAEIPDIIISDVKMPLLDGFDLCKRVRKDIRTSHIPFIFITGKTDQSSKLTGIKLGADAYLTKPFRQKELIARIEHIIQRRKEIQEHLTQHLNNKDTKIAPVELVKEAAYLRKIRTIVEANLENSQFGVAALADKLHTSKATVLRKVKPLTGGSTAEFIKLIRLQKSNELLENTNLSIGEIAVKVGFKEHAYFSKCYQEQFGYTPKDRRKKVAF